MTAFADSRLAPLFAAIDTAAERLYVRRPERLWWGIRPAAEDRATCRRRATGAALKYLGEAAGSEGEVTREGLEAAVVREFSGTTLGEVKGPWLSILLPLVVRLVWEWWLSRNNTSHEPG